MILDLADVDRAIDTIRFTATSPMLAKRGAAIARRLLQPHNLSAEISVDPS